MTKFSDLKLDPKVLKAITEAGYDSPTPIQEGAIPPALQGRDVLGIAQTGTGKTAGFTLPMITLLGRGRARARMPRSLVLAPTRELAAQVAENFDIYAKYTKLTKALLIGGVSFGEQDKLIDRGVDVLIATPGRLLDHFERGKLLLTGVQIMVVDEADRMLDMGFIPDIERIFQLTPSRRQTLFFSATMAPEIERITDTFLHSPERIEVARQATASETITQRLIELTPTRKDQTAKQKRELLRALIDAEGEALNNAIIFCNRKTDVDILAKSLKTHGYDAAPIHGDLDQSQRTRTLDDFRDGKLRLLIASDVAARGLDIPSVSHVFNYDLPSHAEDYVHRIGRTGRAGREGVAISIGTPSDEKLLAAIEGLLKQSLPRGAIPDGFTLSAAAQNAPRAQSDRHGRGGERERGRRSGRHSSRDHDRAETGAAPDAAAPAAPATPTPAPRERTRPDRARDEHHDGQREGHRSDHRRDHRHERRDDHRNPVLGLGEHVPDFMLRSFRSTIELSEARGDEAAPAAKPAPAVTIPIEVETPAAEAPAVEAPVAEKPDADKPVAEKPKRRSRKKPQAVEVAEVAADPGTDAAPKDAAPTVEEPPAPKARKPRKKAAPVETGDAPEPVKKPARKRVSRKAKDAAPTDAATGDTVPPADPES